jgi:hypothetical protein
VSTPLPRTAQQFLLYFTLFLTLGWGTAHQSLPCPKKSEDCGVSVDESGVPKWSGWDFGVQMQVLVLLLLSALLRWGINKG